MKSKTLQTIVYTDPNGDLRVARNDDCKDGYSCPGLEGNLRFDDGRDEISMALNGFAVCPLTKDLVFWYTNK